MVVQASWFTMVGLCGNSRSSQGFKSASEAGFICISAGTIHGQQAACWSIYHVGVRLKHGGGLGKHRHASVTQPRLNLLVATS